MMVVDRTQACIHSACTVRRRMWHSLMPGQIPFSSKYCPVCRTSGTVLN